MGRGRFWPHPPHFGQTAPGERPGGLCAALCFWGNRGILVDNAAAAPVCGLENRREELCLQI
ncbi:hypothetical protein HMPREF0262_00666 [Clostridium sp. ATCC 29733]|nr:hypothetical protein HMPREF0262_00666 [Clostridium sp. ATCC 29733]